MVSRELNGERSSKANAFHGGLEGMFIGRRVISKVFKLGPDCENQEPN